MSGIIRESTDSNLQLLVEDYAPSDTKMIVESSKDQKKWYMNGIFMMAESRNRNNRIYSLHELTQQVNEANKTIKETNGILGELDHPKDRLETNTSLASHVITEMWMNGNNAHGKAMILPTPAGKIVQAILEAGVILGVSSRGTGRVDESGRVSSFVLKTIDIVTTPSAQNAYPEAIHESIDNYRRGKHIKTLAECAMEDVAAQKYLEKEIIGFLNHIKATKL